MLSARPAISKRTKLALALRALGGKTLPFLRLHPQSSRKGRLTQEVPSTGFDLGRAYEVCREIAKREAKNFYYAFVALPSERRNAICAIYAFMRQADDLADDESLPREERRRQLNAWLAAWHAAAAGAATNDPVFVAVRDAIRRFKIPLELLDELVAGVAMDLDRAQQRRRRTPTRPSPISIATATWSRRSSAWSAFASSATATRAPKNWPKKPASHFSSPTFCATWPRMPRAIASICRSKTSPRTESRSTRCCIAHRVRRPRCREELPLLEAMAQRAEDYYSFRA